MQMRYFRAQKDRPIILWTPHLFQESCCTAEIGEPRSHSHVTAWWMDAHGEKRTWKRGWKNHSVYGPCMHWLWAQVPFPFLIFWSNTNHNIWRKSQTAANGMLLLVLSLSWYFKFCLNQSFWYLRRHRDRDCQTGTAPQWWRLGWWRLAGQVGL